MATKELWLNLPVKDINQAKGFYSKIGFTLNAKYGNSEHSACFLIGSKAIALMLFSEQVFKGFVQNSITDTKSSNEILISIDAESRSEVDDLAIKAKLAGGIVFAEPGENQGWMYGCGFSDPDGHRWNVLFMDMSKMPQQ